MRLSFVRRIALGNLVSIIKEFAQITFVTIAPLSIRRNTEPALPLQEIKKNNLAQQLLCEIGGLNEVVLEILIKRTLFS